MDYLTQLPPTHIWHTSYLAQNPMEFQILHDLVLLRCDGDTPDARFEGLYDSDGDIIDRYACAMLEEIDSRVLQDID